jgi:hypothetical protein
MPFVVIDGTPYDVVTARRRESRKQGGYTTTFNNTERSSVSGEKLEITFDLYEMSLAAYNGLVADTLLGSVPVSGDALGVTITANVKVKEAEYVRDGVGFLMRTSVDVSEV